MTEEKDLLLIDDVLNNESPRPHTHVQHRFNLERRESTKKAAILELDVDLDEFNAIHGSSFSDIDEVLKQIGHRLRHRLRDNDVILPMTGDKFMVLLEDIQSADNADSVANELIALLKRPYELSQSNDVKIGTKIRISFFSSDEEANSTTSD